jgi:hypothetical protein
MRLNHNPGSPFSLHIYFSPHLHDRLGQSRRYPLRILCVFYTREGSIQRELPLCFRCIYQGHTCHVWLIRVSISRPYSHSQFLHLRPVLSMNQLGGHHEPRFRLRHPHPETAVSLVIFGMPLLRQVQELNSLSRVDTASFTWAPGGFLWAPLFLRWWD